MLHRPVFVVYLAGIVTVMWAAFFVTLWTIDHLMGSSAWSLTELAGAALLPTVAPAVIVYAGLRR